MGRCGVVCLSIVDCVLGWKIGLAALSWVELSLGRRVERGELRELQTIKRNGLCGKLEMVVRCWISRGLASLRSPMLDPSLVLSWISACCWWILSVAVSSGRERKDQTLFEFRQLGVRWDCAIGEVRGENDTVLLSLFEMRSQDILFWPLQLVWCGMIRLMVQAQAMTMLSGAVRCAVVPGCLARPIQRQLIQAPRKRKLHHYYQIFKFLENWDMTPNLPHIPLKKAHSQGLQPISST